MTKQEVKHMLHAKPGSTASLKYQTNSKKSILVPQTKRIFVFEKRKKEGKVIIELVSCTHSVLLVSSSLGLSIFAYHGHSHEIFTVHANE